MVSTQLSIFDIDFIAPKGEVTENKVLDTKIDKSDTKKDESYTKSLTQNSVTKIEKSKKSLELTPEQQKFLDKNEVLGNESLETLTRIILQSCGWMAIEGVCKELNVVSTSYIDATGETEFIVEKKSSVLPSDKIIYHKTDFEINNIQQQRLQEVKQKYQGQIKRIIHRHGDENILVELGNKLLDIIATGWVLEFKETIHVDCVEDEVLEDFIVKKDVGSLVKVGDYVRACIGTKKRIVEGTITREYGLGNSILNISFKKENGVRACTAIGRFAIKAILKSQV
ncbi:hypothetical protein [Clostridium felsineum]|uniref:Uncharacterized protein n=1 Tax=Clostridium felsineum TaxID=36839 RepID=A0A1S8MDS3_9CLOT|nr:hypothetical protein [Clostridium felsineum]URZ06460.1 hypothetical protein CLROS_017930 [Clostridium felsineum]URZ11495.1 hypothetical protein CROST_022120 [Clostridium felsineum]